MAVSVLDAGIGAARGLLRAHRGARIHPDLRPVLLPCRAVAGVEFRFGGSDLAPDEVLWERSASGDAFLASPALPNHPSARAIAERLRDFASVCRRLRTRGAGATHVALGDVGTGRGLAFCDFRGDALLVPDTQFLGSGGYAAVRRFPARSLPAEKRMPRALWRGTATGWHDVHGREIVRQTDLPRVRLCEIAARPEASALIDAKFSAPGIQADQDLVDHMRQNGLLGDRVEPSDFPRWRYQIDIDGNTNAWEGLFIKLLSGSLVLKVASAFGFRQWYYDRLVPWRHVVPVSSDMSDLVDKVEWCRRNEAAEREMTRATADLLGGMTLAGELARMEQVVAEAFRRCP